MTLAVLCGGTGAALTPAAADRLADELSTALRAAGATRVVRTPADPAAALHDLARLARDAAGPVLVCAADLVAHAGLLRVLATEPAGRTSALVAGVPGGGLREERGRVGPGPGDVGPLGALAVAPADLPALAEAAEKAAAAPTDDPTAALLAALLAAGVRPVAVRARLLRAGRVRDDAALAAARTARDAVDEDAALLRLAVKERDDFFTTYAVSSWSPLVTKLCARLRLSPAAVTGLSVLFAVAAAAAFWQASRPALVAGAVLLYLGFVLDCVDGQLARYTRVFSPFGGWLDTMADRFKEYAVYAGLAAGAERAGLPYAWPLAVAAIVLQTVRHMTDTWYGALHDAAAARSRPAAPAGGVGARLGAASERVQADTGSPVYWAKRIVVFPIGERWALIAVLAALTDGRTTLVAVLAWGVLAFGYTLALRGLRSAAMRVGVLHTVDTPRHRDDGPLVRALLARVPWRAPLVSAAVAAAAAAALTAALVTRAVPAGPALAVTALLVLGAGLGAGARHDGPLDWLVPAALRAAEYLTVVAAGLVGAVPPPVVYLLLLLLALWHYDLTARMEKGAPVSGAAALPGWDGRTVLVVASALAGVATIGTAVTAAVVAVGFGTGVLRDRRGAAAPVGGAPESGTR